MRRLPPVRIAAAGIALGATLALTACASVEITPPHKAPLPTHARMLLGKLGMTEQQPIFIRIFKAESELEVWKQRDDGRFYHFKTYAVCHWSGDLGPKFREGDKQAPEGFYTVSRHQLNPNSSFHLAFDLGFPNAFDRANGRTGSFLMVHGKCKSAGCYAMTDAVMEEIYALAREAFAGGQERFHVHAFPFRMTDANLARYATVKGANGRPKRHPHLAFWQTLKQAYDYFEITRQVPSVEICARRYHVNVAWDGPRLDPEGACPRFRSGPVEPFVPAPDLVRASAPAAVPVPVPVSQAARPAFEGRMNLRPHAAQPPAADPIARLLERLAH